MSRIELSFSQSYEIERFSRDIDAATNMEELKAICKKLLHAWMLQKAASLWIMKQGFLRSSFPIEKND